MNDSIQNTYKTLSPLSWLLKLFALNSNVESSKLTLSTVIRDVATAIIFGSLIVTSLCYKFKYIYSDLNTSVKFTDLTQMIYDYCQYIVDLYFVYKYGRIISVEYFKQYDKLDKILGMTSYQHIKRRFIKLILFFTTIWAITSCCDFTAWVLSYGWIIPIMFSVAYIFLFIKIATVLDLTSHVMHIELRLRIIGDLAQGYYTGADSCTELITDCIFNKNWLYADAHSRSTKNKLRPHPIKSMPVDGHHEVKWLTRCYLMLTEQASYVNGMYGFRILLNSLSLLIDMVRFTNIAVRIVYKCQSTTYNAGYLPAISSLIRLLTCIAILVSLASHCEGAYRQRDRIITIIDHLLIYKTPSESLITEMKELRDLITNRPINFTMANFFIINYSLLTSIASVVVTYSIILLQSTN